MAPRVVRSAPWYVCPVKREWMTETCLECDHFKAHHRRRNCRGDICGAGGDGVECVRC
jgi:hypothetical protein